MVQMLVKRFVDGERGGLPEVVVWGDGEQGREFLDVRDAARGIVGYGVDGDKRGIVNFGSGETWKVKDIVEIVRKESGYKGEVEYDTTKPRGPLSRLMDSRKAQKLGWKTEIGIEDSIRDMVKDYRGTCGR